MSVIENFILSKQIIDWLLEGDPSIKWQVLTDLRKSDKDEIHLHRLHVELEGWGKRLLDLRENHHWFNSFFMPKWKSTLWVLLALKRLGIYPLDEFQMPNIELLEQGINFNGGIMYPETKKVHPCLSGILLGLLSYYNINTEKRESIFHYLIETQLNDGGWTCDLDNQNKSSFETTLAVLEGLKTFISRDKKNEALVKALKEDAHELLLSHKLFKSKKENKPINKEYLNFPFPYLRYDIISALDYFQDINYKYDERFEDAIKWLLNDSRDGKWIIGNQTIGEEPIIFEQPGVESRWNTLRALRVLNWWKKLVEKENA